MSIESEKKELLEKAELIMTVEGLEREKQRTWSNGVDYIACDDKSDEKVLLRVITESESRSRTVSTYDINRMVESIKDESADRGILISKRFSPSAKEQMRREGIQIVSENVKPIFDFQTMYIAAQDCVNDSCRAKCGLVPKKKSDCKGLLDGNYTCEVRRISDDAAFHFEIGWIKLLTNDLKKIISLRSSIVKEASIQGSDTESAT